MIEVYDSTRAGDGRYKPGFNITKMKKFYNIFYVDPDPSVKNILWRIPIKVINLDMFDRYGADRDMMMLEWLNKNFPKN